MDIATTPDLYCPSVNEQRQYIDVIPTIVNGIRCPCGARKDKIYKDSTKFKTHTKSRTHALWLDQLNNDRDNHYKELLAARDVIAQQKKIIAEFDVRLESKSLTIDYLTQQIASLNKPEVKIGDLLDI